jgi:hypothetical protein
MSGTGGTPTAIAGGMYPAISGADPLVRAEDANNATDVLR